jgi:hypothetical protein
MRTQTSADTERLVSLLFCPFFKILLIYIKNSSTLRQEVRPPSPILIGGDPGCVQDSTTGQPFTVPHVPNNNFTSIQGVTFPTQAKDIIWPGGELKPNYHVFLMRKI